MNASHLRVARRTRPVVAVLTAAVALLPSAGHAQASLLEGIVKNASDLNIYAQLTQPSRGPIVPRGNHGAEGLGFELTYDLSDSTLTSGGSKPITAGIFGVPMRLEVGIGYAQTGGYKTRDGKVDLYMSLRDVPAFSFYLSPFHAPTGVWKPLFLGAVPYVGARTGLLTIQSGHAYTDTSVFKVDGQTFQIGPVAGLSWDIGHFSVFTEGAYLFRNYPSLDWSQPSKGTLPAAFPRSADLSSWNILIGLTAEIRPHAGH